MDEKFLITKSRHWFVVIGPGNEPDEAEVKEVNLKKFAIMMGNNVDIINAYQNGFLEFNQNAIDSEQEAEIRHILNKKVASEQLEFMGMEYS